MTDTPNPPPPPPLPSPGTPPPYAASPSPAHPAPPGAAGTPMHAVWASPAAGQQGTPYSGPTPPPGQAPTGGPSHPGWSPYPGAAPAAPRRGGSLPIWLAGSALVVALLALVLALVALLAPVGMGAMSGLQDPGAGTGTVPGAVTGQSLSGDRIGYAVVDVLLQLGAEVDPGAVQCDTLLRLDDGSTSDCHGTVDGDESWTGTAEFSGDQGDFTLYED